VTHVDDALTANDAALAEELRAAIDDARGRLDALLGPACPTEQFLAALAEEASRAVADPASVPYPELADPDAYWNASVRPQAASLAASASEIVEWLEERIIVIMTTAETDLKSMVDAAVADVDLDPATARAGLADAVDRRCGALHHLMAEVLDVVPDAAALAAARGWLQDGLRERAAADVDSLKSAYLRDAGGDDTHQRYAEQQWSETFPQRVAHREALLCSEVPWRHMELALVGHERTHDDLVVLVETTAVRLQTPLQDMRGLLLERFDQMVPDTP